MNNLHTFTFAFTFIYHSTFTTMVDQKAMTLNWSCIAAEKQKIYKEKLVENKKINKKNLGENEMYINNLWCWLNEVDKDKLPLPVFFFAALLKWLKLQSMMFFHLNGDEKKMRLLIAPWKVKHNQLHVTESIFCCVVLSGEGVLLKRVGYNYWVFFWGFSFLLAVKLWEFWVSGELWGKPRFLSNLLQFSQA